MVADRCILMPGSEVGRNTVLGSGTYSPSGFSAPGGSVWLGNDRFSGRPNIWQEGTPAQADADTITPYGRALAKKQAPYFVWPLWLHIILNVSMHILRVILWLLPFVAVLVVGIDVIMRSKLEAHSSSKYHYDILYLETAALLCALAIPAYFLLTAVVLLLDIGGKWLIIGRRTPGRYNWDESSYNQRWELHKQLQGLRSGMGTKGHSIVSFWQGRYGAELSVPPLSSVHLCLTSSKFLALHFAA